MEHIFLRLHNLPQLAMKKAKQTLAFQNQAAQIAQGPTDPLLAIKPKETPKKGETKAQVNIAFPRTIAMLPSSVAGKVLNEAQQERAATENREERKDLSRGNLIRSEQERAQKDSEGIGRQGRAASFSDSSLRAFSYYSNRGVQDKRYSDFTRGQRLSDQPRITEFPGESQPSQAKNERSRLSSITNSSNADALLRAKQSMSTPMAPPAPAPLYKIVREFLNNPKNTNALKEKSDLLAGKIEEQSGYSDEVYDGLSGDAPVFKQQRYSSADNRFVEVALLPPSVITGIPLMRLGVSENEATKILASRGIVNKQLIGEWTVWSLLKPHSKETMLQVYLRHGMVEAIRIFDGAFVSPQLGIRFGDTLSAVKQRFGEPRFILSEPASYGQNYVYPISQVCFQLARIRTDSTPQVVSLLIFNVK